jgi:hypothetical protein
MKSQAMRGAMYSAAAGKSSLGIPAKVGKAMVADDKPGKLPARVKRGAGRPGLINKTK